MSTHSKIYEIITRSSGSYKGDIETVVNDMRLNSHYERDLTTKQYMKESLKRLHMFHRFWFPIILTPKKYFKIMVRFGVIRIRKEW